MDLDEALERLATKSTPPQLVDVTAAVLLGLADHRFERPGGWYATGTAVVAMALAMGLAGGLLPERAAVQEGSYAPLSGVDRLAPSRLLAGPR